MMQGHGMMNMENVAAYHHDFQPGAFFQPPPPQQVLFSNPFPSPNEYVTDGFLPTVESMGYFPSHRSMSESFIHSHPNDSYSTVSSGSSSCNVSIGPATPPPAPHHFGPTKFPAVPITPSHVVPRQKAKRTATVSFHVERPRNLPVADFRRRLVRSAENGSKNVTARPLASLAKSKSSTANIARCLRPSKFPRLTPHIIACLF